MLIVHDFSSSMICSIIKTLLKYDTEYSTTITKTNQDVILLIRRLK